MLCCCKRKYTCFLYINYSPFFQYSKSAKITFHISYTKMTGICRVLSLYISNCLWVVPNRTVFYQYIWARCTLTTNTHVKYFFLQYRWTPYNLSVPNRRVGTRWAHRLVYGNIYKICSVWWTRWNNGQFFALQIYITVPFGICTCIQITLHTW